MSTATPLTFADVDDLAMAAIRKRLTPAAITNRYSPHTLGPLLELLHLLEMQVVPEWIHDHLAVNGAQSLVDAIREKKDCWFASGNPRIGFVRTSCMQEHLATLFQMNAQRAARDIAKLPGETPGHLLAAMHELNSNIEEHSAAESTGIMAYRARAGEFEFVVADAGIGILQSLSSCQEFAYLSNHGDALLAALNEGTSRYGSNKNRGYGFRSIFRGLYERKGSLRFRSGDHALTMDGASPDLKVAQLAQKPNLQGFFVSVRCLQRPTSSNA